MMTAPSMFDIDVYVRRRKQLKKRLDTGLLLFLGNELVPMNYADNLYPFWQDSSFLYYWGLDAPGLSAVIDLDDGAEILFGRDQTMDEVVWTGPLPSLQERAERVGVTDTQSRDAVGKMVRTAVEAGRSVHILPPYRMRHMLQLSDWLGVAREEVDMQVSDAFVEAVIAQRAVKSEDEVAEIETALDTAYAMHTRAMQVAAPGVSEHEVAGQVQGIARSRGGRLSFPIIVSVRGEVLHNHPTSHTMEAGELMLCDAGATAPSQYASDITRVTPISGRFTARQRDIYDLVLLAQQNAIDAMRPGVPFRTIHLQAARDLTEGLCALGLMKGDVDEAVDAGAHALFFPHGLGHMMGLDVHDMEGLGEDRVGYGEEFERSDQFGLHALRLARTLEAGFVVTVEPGLYFIPALINQWQAEGKHADFINYDRVAAYRDFGGIRIEDDVLITGASARVLGPSIPKEAEAVEATAASSAVADGPW
jgi:Xaa-Pro aminopeptidase